ncbi:MAG: hypothetical protein H7123_03085, partial [Thermoleophilia bacterium]|nr:hypothetical protein [Thermoleophilia bacterium]
MTLNVTYDVRTANGTAPLQRTRALPPLPADTQPWDRPLVDRIGGVITADMPLVAGAGVIGTIAGAALTRHAGAGILKSLLGGVGGALVGVAATIGAGIFLHRHADDQPKQAASQVAPSTTISGSEHIKVMTYNLHGGMGGPGKFFSNSTELDALAETIRREQPDVLIVQESDSGAARSSYQDTLSELSVRLHPDSAVEAAPAVYGYGRQQHSGVMTFHGFQVDNARELIHADPEGSGVARRVQGTIDDARKVINSTFHTDLKPGDIQSYVPRGTIDTIVRTPGGNDIRVAGGHYNGRTNKYDYPGM